MSNVIFDGGKIISDTCEKFNAYLNVNYSILTTSGTTALEVAIKSLNLDESSLILIPDISFIATATAVANSGMIPVYLDCDCDSISFSFNSFKEKIDETPNIKAVIIVHFAGLVNREIKLISSLCKERGIYLIEDCAQVFGGKINNQYCGTFGDLGVFSFQTSKILTCGEGGLITTNNSNLANRAQMLINWGLDENYNRHYDLPSSNHRISALAAKYLGEQLKEIEKIIYNRHILYSNSVCVLKEKGIDIKFIAENNVTRDVPFFVLAVSQKPKFKLHPLDEYPMHQSKIVRNYLSKSNLKKYESYIKKSNFSKSIAIIESTDFIPLYQLDLDTI